MNSPAGSDAILAEVAPVLQKADLTFGNLESPLTGEIAQGQLFSAPVTGAAILKTSGFKLVNLANNHIYDYGQAGLVATLDAVRKADLIPLGVGDNPSAAQALVRTDMNGLRIGWLGCGRTLVSQSNSGPSFWEFDEQKLVSAIECNRADGTC
jgi:poly-gamma-glutamate synthesis protein (capsule biosynthesis protein)